MKGRNKNVSFAAIKGRTISGKIATALYAAIRE
jgi:transcription initiation factor TFIIIB Brf1 subunit/transcription initiation factor TFIIB